MSPGPSSAPGPPLWVWPPAARAVLIGLLAVATAIGWAAWRARRPALGPPPPAPRLLIDINTAPPGVLNALPGIGPARARAIMDERAKRRFDSLRDLDRRVTGIGPATVRALAPYLDLPASP